MPSGIFISYRREDAAGDAGRLADHLQRRFGRTRVFLDVDGIAPGTDFAQVLKTYLQRTAAVLVVIGPRWASLRLGDGTRRLDVADDFVRFEVEAALARDVLVVPVLVQGATLPRPEDLPPSLAPLANRQAAVIDHAEFHADAERLCASLAPVVGSAGAGRWSLVRRWWPAAALGVVLALGLTRYLVARRTDGQPAVASPAPAVASASASGGFENAQPAVASPAAASGGVENAQPPVAAPAAAAGGPGNTRAVTTLLAEAAAQRRRGQLVEALATLARARELAPSSAAVRRTQEDVAMEWIRDVRYEVGKSTFGEAIKPALAVVDASLASATGVRRADLLAHTGWASYLLSRDGNQQADPTRDYRDALSLDPANPYANAMLAHWVLWRNHDDLPRAEELFATAARSGRALDVVRTWQFGAYRNASTRAADAARVRLADAMRRAGAKLSGDQASSLWAPYYFATQSGHDKEQELLLAAVAPDDHISTLEWAFKEYAAQDQDRLRRLRYYVALLHARAGRTDRAADGLRALQEELKGSPGALANAVRAALGRLQPERAERSSR